MSDAAPVGNELGTLLGQILDLQRDWSSKNTPEMQRRGELVRQALPAALRRRVAGLPDEARQGIEVQGRDGAGPKARIPWARLYSPDASPSATEGWDLVYLFAFDGSRVYLSLNQGTTNPEEGHRRRAADFLRARVDWARRVTRDLGIPRVVEVIDLASRSDLARAYEAGNVIAIPYDRHALPADEVLVSDLERMLRALQEVYRQDLPEGYEDGGALAGFTPPVVFRARNVDRAPKAPGVHVVWSPEKRLLYVGSTGALRDRMRQHLIGDRQASILREKVGRRLADELGRDPAPDEITRYLTSCSAAWHATDRHQELKARIMDELAPEFNEIRPPMTDDRVLCVHIAATAEENFAHGLATNTWGFSAKPRDFDAIEPGQWVLFGRRPSSESSLEGAVLGRITSAGYWDAAPHWADEHRGDRLYPFRFHFEPLRRLDGLDLSDRSLLGENVVDALRRSATGGKGVLTGAIGALFETAMDERVPPVEPDTDLARICTSFDAAVTDANLSFGSDHSAFVRAFVVSLATKRLALLTGLSGSGKTRLAIALGEWLGAERHLVLPVRPDWLGPEPLLGYEDALVPAPEDRYAWHVPEALEFMLRAARDPGLPYVLVLDEMNLAHVERYFADLLSGLESGEPVLPNLHREDDGRWRTPVLGPRKLITPPNLFVVGTVNVDETTYLFSPKVLDRANTIEFRVATEDLQVGTPPPTQVPEGPPELVRGFAALAADRAWHLAHPATSEAAFADHLRSLHRVLSAYGLEFGRRAFDEALRFAALLEAAGEASPWHALDLQVKQKILPRLHGSARRIGEPLSAVARFSFDPVAFSTSASDADVSDLKVIDAVLPLAFDKAQRMLRNLRANQFVSFSE